MTETTMSVQKALNELKLYDAKIKRAIRNTDFAVMMVKEALPNKNITPDQFKSKAQSGFDSATKMIKNRNALKAAVIKSNAVETVTIGGREFTVAEAIDFKDAIEYDQSLLTKMRSDRSAIQREVEYYNERVERDQQNAIDSLFGKDSKKNTEDLEVVNKAYDAKKASLLEGIKDLDDKIEAYINQNEQFLSDVDFALTESNVKTQITVDLDD